MFQGWDGIKDRRSKKIETKSEKQIVIVPAKGGDGDYKSYLISPFLASFIVFLPTIVNQITKKSLCCFKIFSKNI
jgi:hypothetical protein